MESAKGGILLIDEAYSLGSPDGRDSFSKECIDCINQFLSENSEDFVCILKDGSVHVSIIIQTKPLQGNIYKSSNSSGKGGRGRGVFKNVILLIKSGKIEHFWIT